MVPVQKVRFDVEKNLTSVLLAVVSYRGCGAPLSSFSSEREIPGCRRDGFLRWAADIRRTAEVGVDSLRWSEYETELSIAA